MRGLLLDEVSVCRWLGAHRWNERYRKAEGGHSFTLTWSLNLGLGINISSEGLSSCNYLCPVYSYGPRRTYHARGRKTKLANTQSLASRCGETVWSCTALLGGLGRSKVGSVTLKRGPLCFGGNGAMKASILSRTGCTRCGKRSISR